MTLASLTIWALAYLLQDPTATAPPRIPVRLGVGITPDTVTAGQHFTVVVRIRAPRGASVTMPSAQDSAHAASLTATGLIGKPVIEPVTDSTSVLVSAAYRFAAWDVGPQQLGLPDIVVVSGADTGYVSLAQQAVFVKSVLPPDTTQHVPKPPRPPMALTSVDLRTILLAALAAVAAALLWRLWVWYRRRASRALAPWAVAEREFAKVEAMKLVEKGEPERHAALMSDVLRDYLAARVDSIERSHTSSELLARAAAIHTAAPGLGELLWRTDLVKFANNRIPGDEAERLGVSAKSIVKSVEESLAEAETADDAKAA